jgi:hypothetical protein
LATIYALAAYKHADHFSATKKQSAKDVVTSTTDVSTDNGSVVKESVVKKTPIKKTVAKKTPTKKATK